MNKKLLLIAILVLAVVGGALAYWTYTNQKMQNEQHMMMQTPTDNTAVTPSTSDNSTVNQASSPQEQQAQQNLNSLDNGDHN